MKKIKSFGIVLFLIINLFSLTGCDTAATESNEENFTVAVTIMPQQAFVKAVCGDLASIIVIVPPGNSPGNYEPTPGQTANISNAKVYFTIGVPTESANILPHLQNIDIVALADQVAAVYPDRVLDADGRDPHIWLSPKRAIVMVQAIADKMCELDPQNATFYSANTANYIHELMLVDNEIKEKLNHVQRKTFLTFHPSLGYFADDYGLNMVSLEQDGKEANARHLVDMIDFSVQQDIRVVFCQEEIDSKQADAFAEQIGGKKVMLSPLSSDYINNLRSIADAIAEALS